MSDALARLAVLADQQSDAEIKITELEIQLSAAKEALRELSEREIPELMDMMRVTKLTTSRGATIKVSEEPRCGNLKRAEGLAWLRENGQGGLIKSEVIVPIAKGDSEGAEHLVCELEADGWAAKAVQHVHHGSLRATIRTMLEEGVDVPLKTLGAYLQRVTKVER